MLATMEIRRIHTFGLVSFFPGKWSISQGQNQEVFWTKSRGVIQKQKKKIETTTIRLDE